MEFPDTPAAKFGLRRVDAFGRRRVHAGARDVCERPNRGERVASPLRTLLNDGLQGRVRLK